MPTPKHADETSMRSAAISIVMLVLLALLAVAFVLRALGPHRDIPLRVADFVLAMVAVVTVGYFTLRLLRQRVGRP